MYYKKAELWNGEPHWTDADRTVHIYYFVDVDGAGYWNIDDREQPPDNVQNWDAGGFVEESNNLTYGLLG